MINLVVATSYVSHPSLEPVIKHFSNEGALTWLDDCSSTVSHNPENSPLITDIEKNRKNGRITLVVAPPRVREVNLSELGEVLFVHDRKSQARLSGKCMVLVDDFSQLLSLTTLSNYPGICQLLDRVDWTAEDFRALVLARYSSALDEMTATHRAVVFGAQRLGEHVSRSLRLSGVSVISFVDNGSSKHGTRIDGIPVQPLSALVDKNIPIIISTTRFSNSIARQLETEGFNNYIPYPVMSLIDKEHYPDEIPYIGIQRDFSDHAANYLGLFLSLSDDKSRKVLDGLIYYRMDYDSRFAASVADEYTRQYFDEGLIGFDGNDILVDLGGYDGDTAEKFIQFSNGKYSKIYVFEPDADLLIRAKERLKNNKSIEYVGAGAYSRDGELKFSTTGRTNGAISDDVELVIPVRKLDSALEDVPTLIKMDIEGAETDALQGAANIIRTSQPKLAIAAYHFAPDLWKLVEVVRDINPNYKFYLRHYSETGLESVIYAI